MFLRHTCRAGRSRPHFSHSGRTCHRRRANRTYRVVVSVGMRDRACSRSPRGRRTARATHAGPPPHEPRLLTPTRSVSRRLTSPCRCSATSERLPRHGGSWSRERASLPAGPQELPARSAAAVTEGRNEVEDPRSGLTAVADRALPNAGDRPALLIVPGTQPSNGRIDGGFSAGAAPPSYPCGGRGGGATRQSPCVHKEYAGSCHLTDDRSQLCVF